VIVADACVGRHPGGWCAGVPVEHVYYNYSSSRMAREPLTRESRSDREVLKAFPGVAVSPEAFVGR